jgi:hypothetical protein
MKKWLPLAAAALVSILAACSDEGTAENTTPWMPDDRGRADGASSPLRDHRA